MEDLYWRTIARLDRWMADAAGPVDVGHRAA